VLKLYLAYEEQPVTWLQSLVAVVGLPAKGKLQILFAPTQSFIYWLPQVAR
jgi:hypothetical protein